MKISKNISLLSMAFVASVSSLRATVATLQEIQAASSNISYQYSFEGTYSSGTGTWLDQKVGAGTPDLVQGPLAPTRLAEQKTPGYDSSTHYAEFSAFTSGAQGESLLSDGTITYAAAGTIEYLVQFGSMTGSRFLISGDGSGGNDRLRFLATNNTGNAAVMTLGTNTAQTLIGGSTSVAFNVGDWYYVAQNWTISGGIVTMDAWVGNLTAGGPLIQTISGASNAFDGNTTTVLNLGGASNTYAIGNLDALAIYGSQLNQSTILSHYSAIPEPTSLLLMGVAALAFLPSLKRRLNKAS